MNDLTTWLRPSPTAHIGTCTDGGMVQALFADRSWHDAADQSDRAVLHRIMLHLPEEAPQLLQGRVRIVKYGSPLPDPVAWSDPLKLMPSCWSLVSGGHSNTLSRTTHWPSAIQTRFPKQISWSAIMSGASSRAPTSMHITTMSTSGATLAIRSQMKFCC